MLKNEVLYLLERQKGEVVTGGQLARSMQVSRNAIWKAIRLLQGEGNEIVSVPNSGYRLMSTNDTLVEKIISGHLRTGFIGRSMILLPTVTSTNQYLKEQTDRPDGAVVVADEQTGGRGRRNRVFLSPKSQGLYISILLKPHGLPRELRLLTLCAAVSVSKAIEAICGIRADIKWVNDIYCNGKKLCGILTEAVLSGELQEVSTVVVGIGINTGRVPEELDEIATSIQKETGIRGIRNRLAAEVLNQFETVYLDYTERNETQSILNDYKNKLFIIGRKVLVIDLHERYTATVTGLDDTGALLVKDDRGVIRPMITGEINLDWNREV